MYWFAFVCTSMGTCNFSFGEICPQTGHRFSRRSAAQDRPSRFHRCPEGQRHWSNKHRSTTGCSSLLWTEVNTAGSRRCPRVLRVNMKAYFRENAANASFAMRLSKLSKSRSCAFSSVLDGCTSLRLSILVMREDVSDSRFGKRRAGQLHH